MEVGRLMGWNQEKRVLGVTWIDLIRRRREIRRGHRWRRCHLRLHCLGWEVLKLPSLDLAMEFYFWTTIRTLFLISQSKVMLVTGIKVAVMLTQSKIMDSALWVKVERFGEWNGVCDDFWWLGGTRRERGGTTPKINHMYKFILQITKCGLYACHLIT